MRLCAGLVLLGLLGVGCAPVTPVYYEGLDSDRFTRINLRPQGTKLTSAGFVALPATIPPRSRAKVTMYSSVEVHMSIVGVPYVMHPYQGSTFNTDDGSITRFLEKYFVDNEGELDVEAMGPADLKDEVMTGKHVIGMTKEQVYTALGPPAFINQSQPATNLSYEAILAADRWTYGYQMILIVPTSMELFFGDGKLQTVVGG